MSVLLLAELQEGQIHPVTLQTISAAQALATDIHVLAVAAPDEPVVRELAAVNGVSRVRCLDAEHYRAYGVENLAMILAQMAGNYRYVMMSATPLGKSLAPRLAAMIDVAPVTDVCAILSRERFVRPVYAGNLLVTVSCCEPVVVLTIRPATFPAALCGPIQAVIERAPTGPDMGVSRLLARTRDSGERPGLNAARIVVAGGRGLGSKENFERLVHPLAKYLGAAIGATRAAVDAGYAPHDWQVGQTGQIIAPELYIAIGISGAIQHLAGIRNAGLIVAIDRDAEAPIMQFADYQLLGDLNELVPALLAALEADRAH